MNSTKEIKGTRSSFAVRIDVLCVRACDVCESTQYAGWSPAAANSPPSIAETV